MTSKLVEQKRSTHMLAIVSLTLSILGLLPILPLIGSIGGIISGAIARREIREAPELYQGENMARAGIVLGWVGVALALLIGLVVLAAVLFFVPVSREVGVIPGVIGLL